jgi:Rrf2 family protein
MIQIPIRVDYGVRALVDIAINANHGPVKTSDIAIRTRIPKSYLVRILNTFKKLQILEARRGKGGGHLLKTPAESLKLSLILESLDSKFRPVHCIDNAAKCNLSPSCAQRDVWIDVQKSVYAVLSQTTIADLVEKTSNHNFININ